MKNALIRVDIQGDYFAGGKWPVANMAQAADNAVRLLSTAREKGEMVVHVHHEMPEGGPFFVAGTEGAKISPVVAPLDELSNDTVLIDVCLDDSILVHLIEVVVDFRLARRRIVHKQVLCRIQPLKIHRENIRFCVGEMTGNPSRSR